MNTLLITTIILIAIVLFYSPIILPFIKWYKKRTKFVNSINLLPGPKTYPLIGTSYIFFGADRKGGNDIINNLCKKYPRLLRTWVGPLCQVRLYHAEHLELVLGAGRNVHMKKSFMYSMLKPWLGDGLLISDGDKYHSRRKIITPTFHFTILETFCESFAENAEILVKQLSSYSNTGKSFDIYPHITRATLDIITNAAMGVQINAQYGHENLYCQAVYETAELIIRRLIRPWLHPDITYYLTTDGKKFANNLKILHGFTEKVIKQRKDQRKYAEKERSLTTATTPTMSTIITTGSDVEKKKRLAFLDVLLEANEANQNLLTDIDIREEVDTFMLEGHDTTTTAIAWALYMLALHPSIQEQLFEELNELNLNRIPTIQDFNEMKLLDRIIKETLRMYPSVPLISRVLSEDVQIDEFTLPSGCTVILQMEMLHRDERYFPDPERFDPDRFLPKNCEGRHPYAYLPFSAGFRNCIGQKFAIYEEKSIISTIVKNYKLTTNVEPSEIDLVAELVLRPINGIPIILEKRQ